VTLTATAEHRLAAYGTLRPGESNHHIVEEIKGVWFDGIVLGELDTTGRYPTFVYNSDGPPVAVKVLVSNELPAHWNRIDEFEGNGYVRNEVPVEVDGETWICNIYEAGAMGGSATVAR
jgi:gamma-glutamylcyclotransferase (GGCT)/AIG2-like uncharacterized protein YtfP